MAEAGFGEPLEVDVAPEEARDLRDDLRGGRRGGEQLLGRRLREPRGQRPLEQGIRQVGIVAEPAPQHEAVPLLLASPVDAANPARC